MVEPASLLQRSPVVVLFPPRVLPILDIFRTLGNFEEHHAIGTLNALEDRLCSLMRRDLAKGMVSDALLLAFGLRRERREPLRYRPVQCRCGTSDEYRLMALIGATCWNDFHLASEAAMALDVCHPQPLVSLAFDLARHLEAAGLKLEAPDERLLALIGDVTSAEMMDKPLPDPRFQRDA